MAISPMESQGNSSNENERPLDFVSAASVISTIYNTGTYLNFEDVDGNPKERELSLLGKGSVFVAYKREIQQRVPSHTQIGHYDTKRTSVVFKRPKALFEASGLSQLPEEVRGFLMETRILSHRPLYWHPNIITLMGISWYLDLLSRRPAVQPQLVLEVAEQSLDEFLQTSADIPFQTRVRISLNITNGLSAVHACGIIHGDIKPANVLLCKSSTGPTTTFIAKLADFSHSWVADGVPRRRLVGSPKYRAPEIVRRDLITDFRPADVFSLGATLWRVLVCDTDIPVPFPQSHAQEEVADDPYLSSILDRLRQYLESDANENRWPLLHRIFRASLCMDPESRRLEGIQQEILCYLRTGPNALDSEELAVIMGAIDAIQPSMLEELPPDVVFINYQLFQRARGPVQDQLLGALQAICQDPADTRRPRALYELGICNLASLGDPAGSDQEAALRLIFQAAELGEIGARGYMNRLLDAFASGVDGKRILLPELRAPAEWLMDASVAGHEVAFEELTVGGTHRENKQQILRLRASKRFLSVLAVDNLPCFQKLIDETPEAQLAAGMIASQAGDTILHWASYLNLEQHLGDLLTHRNKYKVDINAQNDSGDTPLITACSVGNLEAALCLVQAGANVNLTNTRNETCLHHLWRFVDDEGSTLLHALLARGIDCEVEADPHLATAALTAELDPLPVLPGKAIQRLAGRGRTALLLEFLTAAPPTDAYHGNMVRQMIRWASTLTFPDTRKALVVYARGLDRATRRMYLDTEADFVPIEDTAFELEGTRRGYMDAIAQGWLSIRGDSWKTPDIWWRICCHGPHWWERLQLTMDAITWGSSKALCCYQSTLLLSLQNHSLTFFRLMLQRLTDIQTERCVRNRHQATCTCDRNQSTLLGDGREKNLKRMVRPVDQILSSDGLTLLHLAITMGLRQAFLVLLHEFRADVKQLAQCQSSEDYPLHFINFYALLAMSCKDGWFVNELLNAGLHPGYSGNMKRLFNWRACIPYSGWESSYYLYIPPLPYAFDYGCHFLVRFLLDHGASIQEPITPYSSVFDYILSPAIISKGTMQFLFSNKGYYLAEDSVWKPINSSLLPERLFNEGNGVGVFHLFFRQQQLRIEELPSVLRQLTTVHLSQKPLDVYSKCFLALCAHFARCPVILPFSILFLPMMSIDLLKPRNLWPRRPAKATERRLLGRHVRSATESQQEEVFFNQIWHELLRMFPNAQATPRWVRIGCGFHFSRSLLAMALINNKDIDRMGPWPLATTAICHNTSWLDEAEKKWLQPDSIAMKTTELYAESITYHQPSLVNFFLWDEYDFLPGNSMIAKTLYAKGHRHSLLHFHDIRLAVTLLFLTVPITVFILSRGGFFSTTVCGIVLLYPSLIMSCFDKPYIPFLALNIAIMVAWLFVGKYGVFTVLLGLMQVCLTLGGVVSVPVFLVHLGRKGHFRSKERYLCNALLPGFRYTAYSPLSLLGRMPRGRSDQLEGRV